MSKPEHTAELIVRVYPGDELGRIRIHVTNGGSVDLTSAETAILLRQAATQVERTEMRRKHLGRE